MGFFRENAWALVGAMGLDLVLGDREGWPHPVRWMGRAYLWSGKFLGKPWGYGKGLVGLAFVGMASFLVPFILLRYMPEGPVRLVVEAFLFYWCLSVRTLSDEVLGVSRALGRKDLAQGRRRVARLVGRDTCGLSGPEVARAAVETTGESFVDGFLSPIFWGFWVGVPGAFFFKAVSTGDSMIGHPEEPYRRFGWAAARMDDAMNFIPARLVPLVLMPAAFLCGLSARGLWGSFWSDRLRHPSPNAAHGEAAFAGALGIRLGGMNRYGGKPHRQALLNVRGRTCGPEDVARAVRLLWAGAGVLLALLVVLAWGLP